MLYFFKIISILFSKSVVEVCMFIEGSDTKYIDILGADI